MGANSIKELVSGLISDSKEIVDSGYNSDQAMNKAWDESYDTLVNNFEDSKVQEIRHEFYEKFEEVESYEDRIMEGDE